MPILEYWLLTALFWGTLAVAGWAFVDSITRPMAAFTAAEKLTKPGWMLINGLALLVLYLSPMPSLLGIVGLIAVGVYLTDVRPAVRSLGRGGSRW